MTEPLLAGDPRVLGGFTLTGRLGEGGQGTVFLAEGPDGRAVAVKLLQARLNADAQARAYFQRELTAAQQVDPFCTARVLAADMLGQTPYIVSDYIPGPSLKQAVLEQGPRQGDALVRLAIGTATALTAIHQAGIVHRDFKPGNVIMGPDGPRVIDFGIARILDVSPLTSQVIGTPAYMAPEQLTGRELTPAVDMWAWGATIAYAASGRAPFGTDSVGHITNRILNAPPEVVGLPGQLHGLVVACLDKDPARRPTARQALLALLGHHDTEPRTLPLSEPVRARSRALLVPVAAAVAVLVVVAALLVVRLNSGGGHADAGPPADPSPTADPYPAGTTWFTGGLGLVLPAGAKAVQAKSDGYPVGTHVVMANSPACDPNVFFGDSCTGFWVMGAEQIANADHGEGAYEGLQSRYYPAGDVEPCYGGTDLGYQNEASLTLHQTAPIGDQTVQYVEWSVTCVDNNGKGISGFTQREWFDSSRAVLIIALGGEVAGMPSMLQRASWRES